MCTPTSCSSAPYSSHSRSRSVEAVDAARLVEDGQREPRDLLRVLRPVAAALAELDDAAAADVGIALDLADARAVAVDVVEDEAFAQREVAERELVGAEPPDDRVEAAPSRRPTRSARRGSSPGIAQPLLDVATRSGRLRSRCSALALTRAVAQILGAARRRSVDASAPRLRIVPDVPITRSKPALGDLVEIAAHLAVEVLDQPALVARRRAGRVLTNRSVSRMTPSLKLRPSVSCVAGAERDLDAAAADVDDDGRSRRRCRRRSRRRGG